MGYFICTVGIKRKAPAFHIRTKQKRHKKIPTPRFQRGVDGLSFVTTAIHLTNGRKINPHSIFESSLKPITFEQKLN